MLLKEANNFCTKSEGGGADLAFHNCTTGLSEARRWSVYVVIFILFSVACGSTATSLQLPKSSLGINPRVWRLNTGLQTRGTAMLLQIRRQSKLIYRVTSVWKTMVSRPNMVRWNDNMRHAYLSAFSGFSSYLPLLYLSFFLSLFTYLFLFASAYLCFC